MAESVDVYMANSNLLPEGWEEQATQVAERYGTSFEARFPLSTRREALCSGILLRLILGVRTDDDLVIGRYGKPRLAKGYPYFNLTDVDGWSVLAVASQEVGVDAESAHRVLGSTEFAAARRVFTTEEQRAIAQAPSDGRARLFARAWTRLEAKLKGDGRGFSVDPHYEQATRGWQAATAESGDLVISCALKDVVPRIWLRPVSSAALYELICQERGAGEDG